MVVVVCFVVVVIAFIVCMHVCTPEVDGFNRGYDSALKAIEDEGGTPEAAKRLLNVARCDPFPSEFKNGWKKACSEKLLFLLLLFLVGCAETKRESFSIDNREYVRFENPVQTSLGPIDLVAAYDDTFIVILYTREDGATPEVHFKDGKLANWKLLSESQANEVAKHYDEIVKRSGFKHKGVKQWTPTKSISPKRFHH